MNILSIQSHVAYGHVGNAAVVLPLQRLGHEVWPVHTVMLSNHAAYPDYGGCAVPPAELASVIDALEHRGALARCDLVLSGYLGDVAAGDVVLDAVARARNNGDGVMYGCDPVMGDDGAIYVDAAIPQFMRERAAPLADILTPNLFELAMLTGQAPDTLSGAPLGEIIAAAKRLIGPQRRTSTVLITSLFHAALASSEVAMAAVTETDAWLVTMPKLSFATAPHGAGDCCAALFCTALSDHGDPAQALSQSASAIHAVLQETARLGKSELALVEAQDQMVAPRQVSNAEAVR